MNMPAVKVLVTRDKDEVPKRRSSASAFTKISSKVSTKLGSSWAFFIALIIIIGWAVTGPVFNYSDTWQLFINTGTTIVTFLMVFVIQNTQNRDGKAVQIKLDELIKSSKDARSEFVSIEDLSEHELDELNNQFREMHEKIRIRAEKRAAKIEMLEKTNKEMLNDI